MLCLKIQIRFDRIFAGKQNIPPKVSVQAVPSGASTLRPPTCDFLRLTLSSTQLLPDSPIFLRALTLALHYYTYYLRRQKQLEIAAKTAATDKPNPDNPRRERGRESVAVLFAVITNPVESALQLQCVQSISLSSSHKQDVGASFPFISVVGNSKQCEHC